MTMLEKQYQNEMKILDDRLARGHLTQEEYDDIVYEMDHDLTCGLNQCDVLF